MDIRPYMHMQSPRVGFYVELEGCEVEVYLRPEYSDDGGVTFNLYRGIGSPQHDEVLRTFTVTPAMVLDEEEGASA